MSRNSMILPFIHSEFYIILIQLTCVRPDLHRKEDEKNQALGDFLPVSSL